MSLDVPDWLQGRIAETISILENEAIYRENFATILSLVPVREGNQWCVLYGENLQAGIAGFGDTPWEAMQAFHAAMLAERANSPSTRTEGR